MSHCMYYMSCTCRAINVQFCPQYLVYDYLFCPRAWEEISNIAERMYMYFLFSSQLPSFLQFLSSCLYILNFLALNLNIQHDLKRIVRLLLVLHLADGVCSISLNITLIVSFKRLSQCWSCVFRLDFYLYTNCHTCI